MPEESPPLLPEPKEIPGWDPDEPIMGIRWPANRLTRRQMTQLRYISRLVKLPVTALLKDAVDIYLSGIQRNLRELIDGVILPTSIELDAAQDAAPTLVAETTVDMKHDSPTQEGPAPGCENG
ncbi:MAG: hypothetical protein U0936_24365 [Planctomycetaceae bacterium]